MLRMIIDKKSTGIKTSLITKVCKGKEDKRYCGRRRY